MNPASRTDDGRTDAQTRLPRRRFLAIGAGVGATLLAGCSGSGGAAPETGEFRLLVSDQPADIGDFDSLDVTLDTARIFRADTATEGTAEPTTQETTAETETPDGTTAASTTEEETVDGTEADDTEAENGTEAAEAADAEDYTVIDLDGATVDLTQVVGDAAIGVFEGELEVGSYAKIELHVEAVDGVVDGESVAVKIPSEKLQLTRPFEITAEEPVEFVFDINVVKRGPTNGYILTPVISESGVAGRDVEYEEVPRTETTTAAE
jgi:hypothetical protein